MSTFNEQLSVVCDEARGCLSGLRNGIGSFVKGIQKNYYENNLEKVKD